MHYLKVWCVMSWAPCTLPSGVWWRVVAGSMHLLKQLIALDVYGFTTAKVRDNIHGCNSDTSYFPSSVLWANIKWHQTVVTCLIIFQSSQRWQRSCGSTPWPSWTGTAQGRGSTGRSCTSLLTRPGSWRDTSSCWPGLVTRLRWGSGRDNVMGA